MLRSLLRIDVVMSSVILVVVEVPIVGVEYWDTLPFPMDLITTS
jgi:hypothetical protein